MSGDELARGFRFRPAGSVAGDGLSVGDGPVVASDGSSMIWTSSSSSSSRALSSPPSRTITPPSTRTRARGGSGTATGFRPAFRADSTIGSFAPARVETSPSTASTLPANHFANARTCRISGSVLRARVRTLAETRQRERRRARHGGARHSEHERIVRRGVHRRRARYQAQNVRLVRREKQRALRGRHTTRGALRRRASRVRICATPHRRGGVRRPRSSRRRTRGHPPIPRHPHTLIGTLIAILVDSLFAAAAAAATAARFAARAAAAAAAVRRRRAELVAIGISALGRRTRPRSPSRVEGGGRPRPERRVAARPRPRRGGFAGSWRRRLGHLSGEHRRCALAAAPRRDAPRAGPGAGAGWVAGLAARARDDATVAVAAWRWWRRRGGTRASRGGR